MPFFIMILSYYYFTIISLLLLCCWYMVIVIVMVIVIMRVFSIYLFLSNSRILHTFHMFTHFNLSIFFCSADFLMTFLYYLFISSVCWNKCFCFSSYYCSILVWVLGWVHVCQLFFLSNYVPYDNGSYLIVSFNKVCFSLIFAFVLKKNYCFN